MINLDFFFNIIEFIAFILPAIPDSISIRLAILLIYFIGHYYKLQYTYLTYKKKMLQ